jgi:hypothetical protein
MVLGGMENLPSIYFAGKIKQDKTFSSIFTHGDFTRRIRLLSSMHAVRYQPVEEPDLFVRNVCSRRLARS